MSRKLYKHLSKHWNLTESNERLTTLPLDAFNQLNGLEQREYIKCLIRIGFRADSDKYKHHLKKLA